MAYMPPALQGYNHTLSFYIHTLVLSCSGLQELWDTLGVCGVASMPPALQGYHHGHVSTSNGTSKSKRGLVLAPEASTALTLIVDLANSHVGLTQKRKMIRADK